MQYNELQAFFTWLFHKLKLSNPRPPPPPGRPLRQVLPTYEHEVHSHARLVIRTSSQTIKIRSVRNALRSGQDKTLTHESDPYRFGALMFCCFGHSLIRLPIAAVVRICHLRGIRCAHTVPMYYIMASRAIWGAEGRFAKEAANYVFVEFTVKITKK